MRAKEEGVAGQALFIEGWWVGCLLIDWLGWVTTHLLIMLSGRQGLWKKEVSKNERDEEIQLKHAKLGMAGSLCVMQK
jgi:hypothetical protein